MLTLIEVVKDLWQFVLDSLFVRPTTSIALYQAPALPVEINKFRLPLVVASPEQVSPTPIPSEKIVNSHGDKAYIFTSVANVFTRPVLIHDGVFLKLPYATPVEILAYEGRFARVSVSDRSGFILKDEITTNYLDVLPEFYNDEIYTANHPDTKKLRKLIGDEFFTSEMFMPLQSVEFLFYRLASVGRKIVWPEVRPRLAGTWQNLLKGRLGIQIGVVPKAGAIIEYNKSDGTGFVGFTKSVHVDETILIEGVGRLIEGEFKEETISKEEWHEWRPIWIAVS